MIKDTYLGEDESPLSLNLYTYCHNDPVNFIDPNGHREGNIVDAYSIEDGAHVRLYDYEVPGSGYVTGDTLIDLYSRIDGAHFKELQADGTIIEKKVRAANVAGLQADYATAKQKIDIFSRFDGYKYVAYANEVWNMQADFATAKQKIDIFSRVDGYKYIAYANEVWDMQNDFATAKQKIDIYSRQDGFMSLAYANEVWAKQNDFATARQFISLYNSGSEQQIAANLVWELTEGGKSTKWETSAMMGWRQYREKLEWEKSLKYIDAKFDRRPYNEKPDNDTLFRESDLNLNPEVQQMISYYDDMYLYSDVAYEKGIIDESEYTVLRKSCEEKTDALRQSNKIEEKDNMNAYNVVTSLGGLIPYAGVLFDVMSDPTTAYAASYDMSAIEKISDPKNFSTITNTIARNTRYDFKYTVYELYDDTGVKYVGRTRQNIEARQKQHWKADPAKNGLDIRAVQLEGKTLKGLSHSEARGLEHLVFENYGGFNNKALLNKIRPLNIDNPKIANKVAGYLDDAWKFLKKVK